MYDQNQCRLPALVALEDVLATISTHSWICRHRRTTSWALQGFSRCLDIVVEVGIFNHQVARDDWQRKLNLHFCLPCRQHYLLCTMPQARPAAHKKNHLMALYPGQSRWASIRKQVPGTRLFGWVKILRPTWHKIGHFRDILPSQSLGLVLKRGLVPHCRWAPGHRASYTEVVRQLVFPHQVANQGLEWC